MKIKNTFPLLLIFSAYGCCFPIPYTEQSYESGVPFPSSSAPEFSEELAPYFVRSAFVKARVDPEYSESVGRAAFSFLIAVEEGPSDQIEKVELTSIDVRIDGEVTSGIVVRGPHESGSQLVPLETVFDISDPQHGAYYFLSDEISPTNADFRRVQFNIGLKIYFSEGAESRQVEYEFDRMLNHKLWQCIEV